MAVEGLQVVLDKEPVVGTPTADQFLSAPEAIDSRFLRHVRSYVPFGDAGGAGEEGLSIAAYEKRLIGLVKDGAAPKGYITADFGYGKTSTALYLWHRCREAGLLAVPPFQLGRLEDLVTATFGWVRYELGRRAPGLVPRIEAIHRTFSDRSIEADAAGDPRVAARLRELMAVGRYSLTLSATDYVSFFEHVSALGEEAGFGGLVVLPDEVQQYVESSIKAGRGDPIPPLHNIVEALVTRKGRLRMGLIFSIPSKELGAINDRRGDLVQRLKMDRLGLDLGTVYDKHFARRLWQQLAREFDFAAEADRIVTPATLNGLGQISARDDLANGPRTTIAAFKHMVRRYRDAPDGIDPFGPIDLVDAFLSGDIPFDGTSQLQRIVNQHLAAPFVADRPDARRVVKLLAAFPTDGASPDVVRAVGLWDAAQELQRLTQGDIVVLVGGGRDDQEHEVPFGLALRGLEPLTGVASDWLTATLREFSRNHVDRSEKAIERAERAFARLLTTIVFKEPDWKLVEQTPRRLTDSMGLLLEGSFSGTKRRYPERRVFVRILRDGEAAKGGRDADFTIDVVLDRALDQGADEGPRSPGLLERDGPRVRLTLNLFYRASEQYYADLQATLQPVVLPWQVSPLLLLALHEVLEEKRRTNLIPKEVDRDIEHTFQPSLFEHSADELLNATLGSALNARGPRVMEELVRALCEERFPSYHTLMRQQGWLAAIQDYTTALERLPSRYERQGTANVDGTKEEIAKLFNRANTSLDAFGANFPELFNVVRDFKGKTSGTVCFRLHPFEEHIRALLGRGKEISVRRAGHTMKAREIRLDLVQHAGEQLGYRQREIGAVLELMAKRELIEISSQRGLVQEMVHPTLSAKDVAREVDAIATRLNALLAVFPDDASLMNQAQPIRTLQAVLKREGTHDEKAMLNWSAILRTYGKQIAAFLLSKQESLRRAVREMAEAPLRDMAADFALREPLGGGLFASHLDAVRATLLDQADTLRTRRDSAKSRAMELLSVLRADVPTDELVCRGHVDLSALRQQMKQIELDAGVLESRGGNFNVARRVLQQATDLQHQLTLGLGDEEREELGEAFNQFAHSIQRQLSRHKLSGIEQAPEWETELVTLRNRLNRMQADQIAGFEALKGRYLTLLQRFVHLPPGMNPFHTTFNPSAPGRSLQDLAAEVSGTLHHHLDQMATLLDQWTAGLRQKRAGSGVFAPDFIDEALSRITTQLDAIRTVSDRIAALKGEAENLSIIQQVDNEGQGFPRLLVDFQAAFSEVKGLGKSYAALDAAARQQQLDPQESTLLGEIERAVKTDGGLVDIGALLNMAAPSAAANGSEVWRDIHGLYAKGRIRIQLMLVPRSDG